jgi:hypothetical protein
MNFNTVAVYTFFTGSINDLSNWLLYEEWLEKLVLI